MPGMGSALIMWGAVALAGVLAGWLANRAADVLPAVGPAGAGVQPGDRKWPRRFPALMAVVVAAFLLGWYRFADDLPALVTFWLFATYFLTVLVIDLEHRRVLDIMSGPAALVALALAGSHGLSALGNAALGGLVGFGFFLLALLLSRGKLGMGDVKLAGDIGLATGYPQVVSALFLGVVLGGLASLILLIGGRIGLKSYLAYAPYLCLGALAVLFFTLG
ncbi:MAG: leader peptidase (prepilin peptidase) / N-methyltransferase [Chloroflexota bacterium]|nr:leader peptidase (prepilin peptidase) / N-methyltransferase [Chloroflexota bacterium]